MNVPKVVSTIPFLGSSMQPCFCGQLVIRKQPLFKGTKSQPVFKESLKTSGITGDDGGCINQPCQPIKPETGKKLNVTV